MKNNTSRAVNIQSYIFSSSKHFALQLVAKNIYSFTELDDLEQEILALFYYKTKNIKYDPNKSSEKNWIVIVMESIYKDLIKKKITYDKHFSTISLNDSVSNTNNHSNSSGNYSSNGSNNGNNNRNNSKNNNSISSDKESELIDFIQDNNSNTFEDYYKMAKQEKLFEVIEKLPDDLKELCRLLQTYNVTDISKKLNISRKTIYQKIQKIREVLKDKI